MGRLWYATYLVQLVKSSNPFPEGLLDFINQSNFIYILLCFLLKVLDLFILNIRFINLFPTSLYLFLCEVKI